MVKSQTYNLKKSKAPAAIMNTNCKDVKKLVLYFKNNLNKPQHQI